MRWAMWFVGVGCGTAGTAVEEVGDTSDSPIADSADTDVEPVYSETAVQLAVGGFHTCVLMNTGAVRCWGWGGHGALGYGTSENVGDDQLPVEAGDVPLGEIATEVAAGTDHTCAILASGAVKCWGRNHAGQLGVGTFENIGDNETPASVVGIDFGETVTQIAAGSAHTCALVGDGDVWCWGQGTEGQTGHAGVGLVLDPFEVGPVDLGGPAVFIAAGGTHTCAVLATEESVCWGAGALGLGDPSIVLGDDEPVLSEGTLPLEERVIEFGLGWYHTCARLESGGVECWGDLPMVGAPEAEGVIDAPNPVDIGYEVAELRSGFSHSCALSKTGDLTCWGFGSYGKLGYGSENSIGDDETPASVGPLSIAPAVMFGLGNTHTCAMEEGGDVRCWGYGAWGQLGYGNSETLLSPSVEAVPYRLPVDG